MHVSALILRAEKDIQLHSLQPLIQCSSLFRLFQTGCRSAVRSGVYLAKLCEKCNDKEDDIEDEEKDPIGPTQVEVPERDHDKRQDQRQTQRSCENPR